MKPVLKSLAVATVMLAPFAAAAEEQKAYIEVSGLYCSSCPYIAAQAIQGVPSARITKGFYDPQAQLAQFEVKYDDAAATVRDLVDSTMQYGYPAHQIERFTAPGQS